MNNNKINGLIVDVNSNTDERRKRELARKKNFSHIKYLLEEADYQLIDSRSQIAFKYNDNGLLTLERYNPTTKEIIPDSPLNRDHCDEEVLDRSLTILTSRHASFLINELTKRIYALHPSITDKSIH